LGCRDGAKAAEILGFAPCNAPEQGIFGASDGGSREFHGEPVGPAGITLGVRKAKTEKIRTKPLRFLDSASRMQRKAARTGFPMGSAPPHADAIMIGVLVMFTSRAATHKKSVWAERSMAGCAALHPPYP
jgi:hypothetical protein